MGNAIPIIGPILTIARIIAMNPKDVHAPTLDDVEGTPSSNVGSGGATSGGGG